ncbi:transporter, partial [Halobacteriales archaeon QH_10_67_13]
LIEGSGWVFYNAQFVDVEFSAGGQSESANYVTGGAANLDVPAIVYHLIPVVLLVLAGIVVARQAGAVEIGEGAMAGATLVAGVAVLALVGSFVFTISQSAFGSTVETGPPLVQSLLFVGVGYPVVLGAVGGAIGSQL